ncbi:hypothetical protein Scani_67790 [Streptomyces caniferus]|uniref:Uncharacterized protein n=1 Tax=Streptomyces caniferus TaxID=285557 RepID=A0A640SJK6_9ACTN|nr:hypothetical protein Scani_67790 [Streptomyces caniferus]
MTLGKAVLELAAEVVLVPDDRLPGVNGEDVWRGIEHVAQRFALVRLGPGECEQDRQSAECAHQVQTQPPEVSRV